MAKDFRTDQQTQEELNIQLHLMNKACKEFDAGDVHEIRNIARALRVIVASDDHGDASLLVRANHGDKKFPDTRILTHPRNLVPEFMLAGVVFGPQTIGVRAFLDDAGSNGDVDFAEWLEQIIADDKEENRFSRLRLIKAVANLAGGTHFPSDIRNYYAKLEQTTINAESTHSNTSIPLKDVEKHSLRQIAFEVLKAFGIGDGRGVRAEAGAILIRSTTMLLYPGREVRSEVETDVKKQLAPFAQVKPHGLNAIAGLAAKLPYDQTGKNAQCPCGSNLRFKQCCAKPNTFDEAFIDNFEKRHNLGRYWNAGIITSN